MTGIPKSLAASIALMVLACVVSPGRLRADGGIVRMRETQGPFVVTLFSPASVAADLPTDLTVMVQKAGTGEVVMDATVDVNLIPPAGVKGQSGDPFCGSPGGAASMKMETGAGGATFRATRAAATNRLLYGLPVVLRAPGNWQLRATVWHGGQSAVVSCVLPVQGPSPRIAGLWFCLALPPCLVALFALNQGLRRQAAATLICSLRES